VCHVIEPLGVDVNKSGQPYAPFPTNELSCWESLQWNLCFLAFVVQHVARHGVRSVRIQCDLRSRYTKLRLWEAEDEFDLILYMDCDTLAIGRVEAALDWFAPNGTAKAPLGAVYDILGNRTTFNAGVLAVRTNRTLFQEMMQAAEKEEVAWEGRFAEQVVLFHHLQDLFLNML
jgi:hypothetical protein